MILHDISDKIKLEMAPKILTTLSRILLLIYNDRTTREAASLDSTCLASMSATQGRPVLAALGFPLVYSN
jgi:hypothetical protein